MSRLSLYLFGNPRLVINEELIMIERRKVTALLVYLAMTPHAQSRDSLATFLWPGYGQTDARGHLRRTLSVLNKTIGKEWLETNRQSIRLIRQEGLWVDAVQFEELVDSVSTESSQSTALSILAQAVDLYNDDFLAGFTLSDSPDFDDWQTVFGEQLRQKLFTALEKLVQGYSMVSPQESEQAILYAQRWLQLDPLHEPAYRHLMQLYAWRGDRVTAMAQYRECIRLLAEELGAEPEEATTTLYEQIRTGEVTHPATNSSAEMHVSPESATTTFTQRKHNIPTQLTSFLGREEEVERLQAHLGHPDTHLVTIVGEGGIGKSRLALVIAEKMREDFDDGVWFVPLVGSNTQTNPAWNEEHSGLLATTIAEILELRQDTHPDQPIQDQLLAALAPTQCLLILDNFEYLMSTTDFVLRLLQQAPGVRVLLTSREPLRVQAEHIVRLMGLPVPNEQVAASSLTDYACIQLFIQRGKHLLPEFSPDADTLSDISQICQLVAGIPLGIELAAAWVEYVSCAEIVDALRQQDLDFLTTDYRDLPERHRSLRNVFEYSWALLTPSNQRALAQLSVFQGTIQRQAALAVIDGTMRDLMTLVNKSFLHPRTSGEFEMHSLLRQFAVEKLAELNRVHTTSEKHAIHFLSLIQQREEKLIHRKFQAVDDKQVDLDNVRVAWDWAVENDAWELLSVSATGLVGFYQERGLDEEGLEVLGYAAQRMRKLRTESGDDSTQAHASDAARLFSRLMPLLVKRRKRHVPSLAAELF